LSVIESTSTRGSAARACHLQDAAAAVGRDQPAARDELGGDDERTRLLEPFTERDHCRYQSA
jgi:hypothetical protein